jgi:hypothetical protein
MTDPNTSYTFTTPAEHIADRVADTVKTIAICALLAFTVAQCYGDHSDKVVIRAHVGAAVTDSTKITTTVTDTLALP